MEQIHNKFVCCEHCQYTTNDAESIEVFEEDTGARYLQCPKCRKTEEYFVEINPDEEKFLLFLEKIGVLDIQRISKEKFVSQNNMKQIILNEIKTKYGLDLSKED